MSVSAPLNRDRLRDPARRELSLNETTAPLLYQPGALWSIPHDAIAPVPPGPASAADYSCGERSRQEG